jgi:hypothetical protein
MNSKKKAILDRIKHLEEAIAKGREYLESGSHAHLARVSTIVCFKGEGRQSLCHRTRIG